MIGETYSIPERIHGIRADVYWRVVRLRYAGHQVEARHCGNGTVKRWPLRKFQRRAIPWREVIKQELKR